MGNFKDIGRLTKDVTCNYTPTGMAVARFNFAIDRGRDKDGKDRGADFPTVLAFGRTAENLEKFSGKGLRIMVEGRLQTGSYEKSNGEKVFTTEIVADRIQFIDWKNQQTGNQQTGGHIQEEMPSGFAETDECVPF